MRRFMIGMYTVSVVVAIIAVGDRATRRENASGSQIEPHSEAIGFPATLLYTRWKCEDELFVEKTNGIWVLTGTSDGGSDDWNEAGSTLHYVELHAVNDLTYQTRLYFESGEQRIKQPRQNEFIPHRVGRWIE